MQQEIKENPVLSAVDIIFTKGQKSKFTESFQQSVSKEAQIICEYLGIDSEAQALCWAMLFGMGIQANSALDIDNFSNYLNVSVLRAFQFTKDLDSLARRKLLAKQKNTRRRRGGESLNYLNLYVPSDLVYAVVNGEPLPSRRKTDMNLYELLDNVYMYFQQRDDGYIDTEELGIEITGLLEENKKLPFVRQVLNYKLPILEQIILLVVCQQFVEGYSSIDFVRLLKTLFVETQKQLACRKEWINSKTKLQKVGLVDLENESSLRNDKAIMLTPKGQELFGEDRHLFLDSEIKTPKDIILPSSLTVPKLFFNPEEQKSIDFLIDLLKPDNFKSCVNRMKDLGMKSLGLTVLLHSLPGLGKSESVNLVSKVTNRCIKKADLTFKSKWYGESERNIKNLFVSYRKLLDTSELEPILLFDEVDGIFGTRKTLSSHSSIDQTENTIQNIILSEMSEFRGILFASSNLICNLDPAFERRFLYKIRLERPNSETRFLIWKDKLPQLGDDELRDLSENWDMSGAQIQNVSTKALMNQILTGKPFTLQEIRKLCESEFLVKKSERRPIGF